MELKIVDCQIIEGGKWEENHVHVWFEDGTHEKIFSYFPDELCFTTSEFIGLTKGQALDLRHQKDVAYLRS